MLVCAKSTRAVFKEECGTRTIDTVVKLTTVVQNWVVGYFEKNLQSFIRFLTEASKAEMSRFREVLVAEGKTLIMSVDYILEFCSSEGFKQLKALAVGNSGYVANIIDLDAIEKASKFLVMWVKLVNAACGTIKALGGDAVDGMTFANVAAHEEFVTSAKSIVKDWQGLGHHLPTL